MTQHTRVMRRVNLMIAGVTALAFIVLMVIDHLR